MRVLIIAANTERINMPTPPLGAAMVVDATRRCGHELELVDLLAAPEPAVAIREAVARVRPEVIGISVRNIDDQDMAQPVFLLEKVRKVVRACRECSGAPVVLGGAGYSIFPAAALEYLGADLGIAGEGELAFPALLECLESGGDPSALDGVYARGRTARGGLPAPARLDDLDYPHDDLGPSLNLEDPDLWVPVQTRRGCPLDCSYCSTPSIEGRTPRRRSPRLVTDDLARLVDAGVRRIQFVDNTFNLPPSYALELCRRIVDLGLPIRWRCILYPYKVTEELAEAMAEAGCAEASIGCESGSDSILAAINKHFTTADVREAVARLRAAGVSCVGFLLLGMPGETRDTVAESLAFADGLGLGSLKITLGARIYPRTPLARIAVEEGVVTADDNLLRPTFYMAPAVAGWVEETVASREWSLPVFL